MEYEGQIVLGHRQTLFRRGLEPVSRFAVVPVDAVAGKIQSPKVALCDRIAELSRTAMPLNGLTKILLHALAIVIHICQVVLGCGVPPFGGGAVVIDCLAIISLDAITLFVEIPQDKLGRSKTLRGCGGEPSCRFFPVISL